MKKNYTREHFELVAAVIATVANADTRKVMSLEWALKLSKTNDAFDSARFIKACDVTPPDKMESSKALHKAGQTLAEANYKNYC
jgi:hypothetical protein